MNEQYAKTRTMSLDEAKELLESVGFIVERSNLGPEYDPFDSYREAVQEILMSEMKMSEPDAQKQVELADDIVRNCYRDGIDTDYCVFQIYKKFITGR